MRGLQAATKQGARTVDGAPCSPQRSPAGQLTGMDGSWPFPACHRGARPYAPCKHSAPLFERVRALPWSQQGVASCHASQPTAIGNLAKRGRTHPGPAARPCASSLLSRAPTGVMSTDGALQGSNEARPSFLTTPPRIQRERCSKSREDASSQPRTCLLVAAGSSGLLPADRNRKGPARIAKDGASANKR